MTTKKEITHLAEMKLNELQAKYAEVIGKETRSHNKTFLLRKIVEALQKAGEGVVETIASPVVSTTIETAAMSGYGGNTSEVQPLNQLLGGSNKWRADSISLTSERIHRLTDSPRSRPAPISLTCASGPRCFA
jgi:hypothetical protein